MKRNSINPKLKSRLKFNLDELNKNKFESDFISKFRLDLRDKLRNHFFKYDIFEEEFFMSPKEFLSIYNLLFFEDSEGIKINKNFKIKYKGRYYTFDYIYRLFTYGNLERKPNKIISDLLYIYKK